MKKSSAKKPSGKPDAIACAREVIRQEIKGLDALNSILDTTFVKAIDMLAKTKGRVVVSGMGKSGHVARKIAATFASTGTPAYFVHPSEASHGDLGMITRHDAVLALSNSGETAELKDLIAYTRRFSIPLIGMIRRQKSQLTAAADIALVLPDVPEASPHGAPTTSTTMMLALGDALAMALLERKGFTRDEYNNLHPGGRLGKTLLLRVKDLMHALKDTPLVKNETPMSQALIAMSEKSFGCVGVVDAKGRLAGIITDGDLRRHMSGKLLSQKAGDVMTKNPVTVEPETLASSALAILNNKKITSLLVVKDEKVQGIIHVHDCLREGVM